LATRSAAYTKCSLLSNCPAAAPARKSAATVAHDCNNISQNQVNPVVYNARPCPAVAQPAIIFRHQIASTTRKASRIVERSRSLPNLQFLRLLLQQRLRSNARLVESTTTCWSLYATPTMESCLPTLSVCTLYAGIIHLVFSQSRTATRRITSAEQIARRQ